MLFKGILQRRVEKVITRSTQRKLKSELQKKFFYVTETVGTSECFPTGFSLIFEFGYSWEFRGQWNAYHGYLSYLNRTTII